MIKKMIKNIDLSFLSSNRFWVMLVGAVIYYLQTKGFIGQAEMILIETIAGGFIAIKSLDRASEKIGGIK